MFELSASGRSDLRGDLRQGRRADEVGGAHAGEAGAVVGDALALRHVAVQQHHARVVHHAHPAPPCHCNSITYLAQPIVIRFGWHYTQGQRSDGTSYACRLHITQKELPCVPPQRCLLCMHSTSAWPKARRISPEACQRAQSYP